MTDFATLVIEVDSSSVPKGTAALEKLTEAGKRTESEVLKLSRSSRTASQAAADLAAKSQVMGASTALASRSVGGLTASTIANTTATIAAREATQLFSTLIAGALTAGIGIAVVAVGQLISSLWTSADASDNAAKHADNYTDALGRQLGQLENVIRSEQRLAAIRSANLKADASLKASALADAQRAVATAQRNVGAANSRLTSPDWEGSGLGVWQAERQLADASRAATKAQEELTAAQIRSRTAQLALVQIVASSTPQQVRLQNQIDKTREAVARGTIEFNKGAAEVVRLQRQLDALGKTTDRTSATQRAAAVAHRATRKAASDEADALTRLLNARRDLLSVPQSISLFEPDNTDRLEMTGISNLFRDVRDATNLFVNTPFDDWAATIPRTADQITTALQGIEVRGFENLSTAITDVITGTSSLKEAFSNLARSIIGDIIQMTVRMLIFRAVSAAFPGSFGNPASIGGGTSSFFNSNPIGGDLFRANGGPVSAGKPYVVGERGPEWFVPRNSGTIIPNQGSGGQAEIVVRIEGSDLLDARIVATSQRTVAAAAPRIVAVSTQHTARTLQRRRIS